MTKKVFEGLKVVEFAWVAVGPQTSKYLADHGATVVRLESHTHFDLFRGTSPFPQNIPGVNRSMFYGKYNSNKYHATCNLNLPQGRELAWKFIEWADVITESFRPGTMKRWGLDYDSVIKVRPDIIYVSTSMQGQTGPFSQYAGVGSMISAVAGFGEISGYPDQMPAPPYGAYSDYFCQRFLSTTLMAAMDHKQLTGKGQWIEQSQLETSVYFNAPLSIDYEVNGHIAGRDGNRLPYAAPHGIYPCEGSDCWIAIAVFNDDQWQAFCSVLGNPDWTRQEKFSSLLQRKNNEDELDSLIGQWTNTKRSKDIEVLLQDQGVPASVVEKSSDLYQDPQLAHRKFYVKMNHAEMGTPNYPQQADFILSKTPRETIMPSPCLGEHNEYVYKELLKLSDDEISDRMADESITTELPAGFKLTTNM